MSDTPGRADLIVAALTAVLGGGTIAHLTKFIIERKIRRAPKPFESSIALGEQYIASLNDMRKEMRADVDALRRELGEAREEIEALREEVRRWRTRAEELERELVLIRAKEK